LAKELNVSYNTLTKWLARNSLKYEPIILFLLKEGIDLAKKIVEIGNGRLYIIKDLENLDKIVLEDYYAL